MAKYGELSPESAPSAPDNKSGSDQATQTKNVLIGCGTLLFLLVAFVGCVGIFSGPEKLTEKCERDLQERFNLKGYSRFYKTGFVTASTGVEVETISWQFFYDGPKGTSIADQEQRAPIYKGQAWCRIEKKTKQVKTRYDRILRFAGE